MPDRHSAPTAPDPARALYSGTHRIEAAAFQRWAASIGDTRAIVFDRDAARAAGYRDAVMPPLFLPLVARSSVVRRDELGRDGRRTDAASGPLSLKGYPRVMAGGERYEFAETLCHGDRVHVRRTISRLESKSGRSGEFLVVDILTEFERDGRLSATLVQTTLAFAK